MIVLNEQYNLYVPAYESRLLEENWFAKTFRNMPKELAPALKLCEKKRNCIQAGSCFGIYPNYLADFFDTVFTFEPNPVLYECTEKNADKKNIWKANYALGDTEETKTFYQAKCGADTLSPHEKGKYKTYDVIQTTIDSLQLEDVDFIMLDIERYEKQALIGAKHTIELCKPVIQVEMHDKSREEITDYLESINYRHESKAGSRDEVWVSN